MDAASGKTVNGGLLRRLWPLLILGGAVALFFAFGLYDYFELDRVRTNREVLLLWVHDHAVLAVLAYMAIYAGVVVAFPPSGTLLTVTGGFLFGGVLAGTYVVFAATLGATLLFVIAKTTVGDYLRQRAGPTLKRMEAGFLENELNYLLVLRLVPLFPFWLVNIAPAFLGVSLRTYVIGTFFGIIPGTFVYASVGNGLGALLDAGKEPNLAIIFQPEILLPLIALAVLALIPVAYKKLRAHRA